MPTLPSALVELQAYDDDVDGVPAPAPSSSSSSSSSASAASSASSSSGQPATPVVSVVIRGPAAPSSSTAAAAATAAAATASGTAANPRRSARAQAVRPPKGESGDARTPAAVTAQGVAAAKTPADNVVVVVAAAANEPTVPAASATAPASPSTDAESSVTVTLVAQPAPSSQPASRRRPARGTAAAAAEAAGPAPAATETAVVVAAGADLSDAAATVSTPLPSPSSAPRKAAPSRFSERLPLWIIYRCRDCKRCGFSAYEDAAKHAAARHGHVSNAAVRANIFHQCAVAFCLRTFTSLEGLREHLLAEHPAALIDGNLPPGTTADDSPLLLPVPAHNIPPRLSYDELEWAKFIVPILIKDGVEVARNKRRGGALTQPVGMLRPPVRAASTAPAAAQAPPTGFQQILAAHRTPVPPPASSSSPLPPPSAAAAPRISPPRPGQAAAPAARDARRSDQAGPTAAETPGEDKKRPLTRHEKNMRKRIRRQEQRAKEAALTAQSTATPPPPPPSSRRPSVPHAAHPGTVTPASTTSTPARPSRGGASAASTSPVRADPASTNAAGTPKTPASADPVRTPASSSTTDPPSARDYKRVRLRKAEINELLCTSNSELSFDVNLKHILNYQTAMQLLTAEDRARLMAHLPPEDKDGLTPEQALERLFKSNEFVASAMADYPRFLVEGVFDKDVMEQRRQRLSTRLKRKDPWKDDQYEAYWGEKKSTWSASLPVGLDALPSARAGALLDPYAGKPRPHADTYYTRLSYCLPDYAAHLASGHAPVCLPSPGGGGPPVRG